MKIGTPNSAALLDHCTVVICAGSGGVGKTTTAAALGIIAARRGRKVVVVTIDPARRLADSLGLEPLSDAPQGVDPLYWRDPTEVRDQTGEVSPGRLVVTMLDAQQTLDGLVERHTEPGPLRERIVGNALYRQLSTNLPGVHEYMALEKLSQLQQDADFDLVILDTPPARNALDFLQAPERLVDALDGRIMQWLSRSTRPDTATRSWVGAGVSHVLALMGKITGQGLLEQMALLLGDLNEVLGGVRARALRVQSALRSDTCRFAIVSTPSTAARHEALGLADFLGDHGMVPGAFIVNQVHPWASMVTAEATLREIRRQQPAANSHVAEQLAAIVAESAAQAAHRAGEDEEHLEAMTRALAERYGGKACLLTVPALAATQQRTDTLLQVANALQAALRRLDDAGLESAQSAEPTRT